MRSIKLAYAWLFALAALFCLWRAVWILTAKFAFIDPDLMSVVHFKGALIALILTFAAPFALAWWALLRQRPSGNKWAIVACIIPVVTGLLEIARHPRPVTNLLWIPVVLGAAGLVLFFRSDRRARQARNQCKSSPLPGDGTSKLVNFAIQIVGVAAAIGGSNLLTRLATSMDLPWGLPPYFALQIVLVIVLVMVIHEAGHTLAGISLGMKLITFAVGPFQWWRGNGKWKFLFHPGRLLIGQTLVVPTRIDDFRRRKVLQVAAGPAASAVAAGMALLALWLSPGRPLEGEWPVIATFANISALVGLLNLVPFAIGRGYSDGAKLYQLWSGGLWADYHRTLALAYSVQVTPLRPRDYDLATIEKAAGTIARGRDELFMHLCAYGYYLDNGLFTEAAASIAKAESLGEQPGIEPAPEWLSVFVFAVAFLRRDAAAASRWWERLEASKTYRPEEHWSSRSALLLSMEQLDEAEEAWNKAADWAGQLPDSGYAEAERNCVRLLRQALDESAIRHGFEVAVKASEYTADHY
ncbi:MAG: hypothetical protein WBE76_08595 [Terracidiphilus sp.]